MNLQGGFSSGGGGASAWRSKPRVKKVRKPKPPISYPSIDIPMQQVVATQAAPTATIPITTAPVIDAPVDTVSSSIIPNAIPAGGGSVVTIPSSDSVDYMSLFQQAAGQTQSSLAPSVESKAETTSTGIGNTGLLVIGGLGLLMLFLAKKGKRK